jgi:hypothetical protein
VNGGDPDDEQAAVDAGHDLALRVAIAEDVA